MNTIITILLEIVHIWNNHDTLLEFVRFMINHDTL